MGLKQEDALFPILFHLALEKVLREMQRVEEDLLTNEDNSLRQLGFADDLDIMCN